MANKQKRYKLVTTNTFQDNNGTVTDCMQQPHLSLSNLLQLAATKARTHKAAIKLRLHLAVICDQITIIFTTIPLKNSTFKKKMAHVAQH